MPNWSWPEFEWDDNRGHMREFVEKELIDSDPEMPADYPPHVPTFATEEEARDFWDTHSSAPYFFEGEDVTNNPPPELKRGPGRNEAHTRELRELTEGVRARMRMGLVTLRMGDDMVAALKEVAARRHLPYQTLMRSWVAERLEQEQRALAAEPDGRDTDGARRLG